jgi:hypothetical protein
MKHFILCLMAVVLIGCATPASKLNRLSVGMAKAEVLQVMGQPQSVSAKDGMEYLLYNLGEGLTFGSDPQGRTKIDQARNLYYVRLKGGVVDSYGRVGDFDSTKIPETKHTIDVNVNK